MKAPFFEQAAGFVLREVLTVADEVLRRGPFAAHGSLLRALVHLRPDDGYRRLAVLAQGDLQLLADLSAPCLSVLPVQPVSAVETDAFMPVVGASMVNLMRLLRVFAQQEETLLILGPTGSGKTRLARFCHEHSQRSGRH